MYRAFTIIELLLVILVVSSFIGLGSFLSREVIERQYVRNDAVRFEQSLAKLQSYARSGYLNDSWSVYFDANNKQYTVFKGTDYDKRDTVYDEIISLNHFVSFQDVMLEKKNKILSFKRPYGKPDQSAVISLRSSKQFIAKIAVNSFGVILSSYSFGAADIQKKSITLVQDTDIYKGSPLEVNNTSPNIWVQTWSSSWHRRGLLKFDLSAIPSSAIITSAILKLYIVNTHGTVRIYGVHKIRQESPADWKVSETNWKRYKSDSDWSEEGGDFAPTATDTKEAGSWPGVPYEVSFSVVSDIQSFIDNPAKNFGWVIKDEDEGATPQYYVWFASSENPQPSYRPVLEVEWR